MKGEQQERKKERRPKKQKRVEGEVLLGFDVAALVAAQLVAPRIEPERVPLLACIRAFFESMHYRVH